MKRTNKEFTREEFEALANREPNLHGNWIYRLEITWIDYDEELSYPEFELGGTDTLYFRSFLDAQNYLKNASHDGIYRSVIAQVPIGDMAYLTGAEWLYDSKGDLIDFTITTQTGDYEDTHFFGRPECRQRFKEGDIVEMIEGDKVKLVLFVHSAPSVDWCWDYYKRCRNKNERLPYNLDYSDDSCNVLEGPDYAYHSHPSPLQLKKPRFPIPPELAEEIKSWHQKANARLMQMRK